MDRTLFRNVPDNLPVEPIVAQCGVSPGKQPASSMSYDVPVLALTAVLERYAPAGTSRTDLLEAARLLVDIYSSLGA